MIDEFKALTKNEDLKYQLQTLASYEKDQLEDCEIEVCYENKDGMEGFASVELMDLGSRALVRILNLENECSELSDNADQIKSNAVMHFVNMMIGAFDSGFVNKNNPTLSEIYQVARNHIKDELGIETPNIVEAWCEATAIDCGLMVKGKR